MGTDSAGSGERLSEPGLPCWRPRIQASIEKEKKRQKSLQEKEQNVNVKGVTYL